MEYEELVTRHERVTADGIPYLHAPNPRNVEGRLIVTFATHNNGARYASLATIYRGVKADILAFRDPSNGYYLRADGGARVEELLREVAAGYDAARILLFGSSMAGYAALRWAIELNAACVVNNPQINLDATAPLAWEPLRSNILRIPQRVNLDEQAYGPRRAVLTVLHSRHPMDIENMRRLFALWLRTPGMQLRIEQVDEVEHRYLIRDFRHFSRLVAETYKARALLEETA